MLAFSQVNTLGKRGRRPMMHGKQKHDERQRARDGEEDGDEARKAPKGKR